MAVVLTAVLVTPSASIAKDWKHGHGHCYHCKTRYEGRRRGYKEGYKARRAGKAFNLED
ncbi:MAG: hypothetical protein V3T60_06875 [Candidatus Binatia bacterium]